LVRLGFASTFMPRFLHVATVLTLLCVAPQLHAQEGEVSLGDMAREVRKAKSAAPSSSGEERVIDNDNFAIMMDKAESARLNGKPVFSIDPSGKTFRMTSPDGSCSLSFDAKATALISIPYVASDLPQDELLKLEGPAAIHDDILEVALHNRTAWELKEIVVGVTVLQPQAGNEYRPAKLETVPGAPAAEKLPDLTVLYHLKGTAAPDSTTSFRANLGGNLAETKDWHWAIVAARGVPPASPVTVPAQLGIAPAISVPAAVSTEQPAPEQANQGVHTDSGLAPR
jgi:hypothetical protein